MPLLKYTGPLSNPEVTGFGHFTPGEAKLVDALTAASFRDPRCVAEGWEVIDDEQIPTAVAQETTTGTPVTVPIDVDAKFSRPRRSVINE